MTTEERAVIEAAKEAARYLPPPSYLPDSAGRRACSALCSAVKKLRQSERVAANRAKWARARSPSDEGSGGTT